MDVNATSRLSSLPETVLFNIAGFLDPQRINLLDQMYPEVTRQKASVLSDRNFLTLNDPAYYRNKSCSQIDDITNAATSGHLTIGDICMQEAQARSLVRILNVTWPSLFTFEKIEQLAATMRNVNNHQSSSLGLGPNPRFLMSGSIPLQAILSRVFSDENRKSDIDMYVTEDALPEVRRAMQRLGLRCHEVSFRYAGSSHPFSTPKIKHIEGYVSDTDPNGDQSPYVSASSLAKAHRRSMRWRNRISPKNRLRNAAVHGVGIVRPTHEENDFGRFPPDYHFTLDADYSFEKVVEVIVVSNGYSPEDIIANFDIEVCKVYFDGERFGNVNDRIYSNISDWNHDWHSWIASYIPLCIPQVNDISRRTSPKDPIDMMKLYLEDQSFENDDHKLLWVMSAFAQAYMSSNKCTIPCLEHGFNNCECTLVSQTCSNFFISFHHKVVKQFIRGLKYIDRGIRLPIDEGLISAFLGEEILLELPPYENASEPDPEHEPDNEPPEMESSSKQGSKRKKDKRERDRDRIRCKRAKMSDAEKAEENEKARLAAAKRRAEMSDTQKAEANKKARLATAKRRAEMSDTQKADARDRDKTAKAKRRAEMSDTEKAEENEKARQATAKRRAKMSEMSDAEIPDLVESWILNMTAKGYQTTEKLSAKKPEPTKVTPEKSAKLSPRERKELCRAKRKLLLTEEAEANSVEARTKKTSIPPPDHIPTSIFHPRNSK
jgi:hypothetical protein